LAFLPVLMRAGRSVSDVGSPSRTQPLSDRIDRRRESDTQLQLGSRFA